MRYLVLVCVLSLEVGAGAQQPPQVPMVNGTGAISGVVIDSATKQPITGAIVNLGPNNRGPIGQPTSEVTDGHGRFAFRDLPASEAYTLSATRFGYFNGFYGRSAGSRIALTEGQWFNDATILMNRPAALGGSVTDEHGDPVVGAFVRVLGQVFVAGQSQLVGGAVVTTDDRGMYRFSNLQPGKYVVCVPNVQASVPASMTPLQLAGLTQQGADSYTSSGRPVPAGDPTIDLDPATALVVGRFPTPAPGPDGRPRAYRSVYFPNAAAPIDSSASELQYGEERSGIDIKLEPVLTSRISGTVQGPAEAFTNLTLRMIPANMEDAGEGTEIATTLVREDGRFTFLNVPAGSYTIIARRTTSELNLVGGVGGPRGLPRAPGSLSSSMSSTSISPGGNNLSIVTRSDSGSQAYWGRAGVSADGKDLPDVVVQMQHAVTLTARIVREGGLTPGFIFAAADPARGTAGLSAPRSLNFQETDGFVIEGLMGGEYVLRISGNGVVKSIVCDGEDYTTRPFDASAGKDFNGVVVTMTDQSAAVSGTVYDARGVAATDAAVIVFPVERRLWTNYGFVPARIKSSTTTTSGTYRLQNLPAGEYFVTAVPAADLNAWQNPKFLEQAAGSAARVTLDWGGKGTVDLTVK
jgi:Carboxypeptidase regulatory-like domain